MDWEWLIQPLTKEADGPTLRPTGEQPSKGPHAHRILRAQVDAQRFSSVKQSLVLVHRIEKGLCQFIHL